MADQLDYAAIQEFLIGLVPPREHELQTMEDYGNRTNFLARANADRFHLYGPHEIQYLPDTNAYRVTEAGGPSYSFANPDFSFRQFRSNLVARWEYKPGSSLYVVWSQGRTDQLPSWEGSFSGNWNALWGTRADNVFLVKLSYWFSP